MPTSIRTILKNFNIQYAQLLVDINSSKFKQYNVRTKTNVKTTFGAESFKIYIDDGLPITGIRKFFPKAAAAETAWNCIGSRDLSWIAKYTPMWNKFADDDIIKNAYGYRYTHHFNQNQMLNAINQLKEDPSSRRIVIDIWDPTNDLISDDKNVPCITHFTLSIVDDTLHSSIFLRSSDVFVGLPYDIMSHTLLIWAIAAELKVVPGSIHATLAHPHLYEPHWDFITNMRFMPNATKLQNPYITYSEILKYPNEYVEVIGEQEINWDYHPNIKPEIIV